jgi:hypothetical protein
MDLLRKKQQLKIINYRDVRPVYQLFEVGPPGELFLLQRFRTANPNDLQAQPQILTTHAQRLTVFLSVARSATILPAMDTGPAHPPQLLTEKGAK